MTLFLALIMKLIIEENSDKVAEFAALYVRNKIVEFNPGPEKYFILGLPTGMIFSL